MKRYILLLLIVLFIVGCSNSSYKQIENTTEEFSKDVYKLLEEFQKEMSNPIGGISLKTESPGLMFLEKYKNKILIKREQEIYSMFLGVVVNCDLYLRQHKDNYNQDEYRDILKKGAEEIYLEIEK